MGREYLFLRFSSLDFFLLHTYLLDTVALNNASSGDSRPPLHIGASRIVDFPSGTSSGEFLMAPKHTFHYHLLLCGF
ncbi:hypothetical protein GcC1_c13478o13 [Golovinomyces cichoracearum]|uniref:Uncharacterized protein n=1 Tax=Golovinomyces cichoracearum TaxID=62708 RepID=A0A420J320_9PEZI|nr:hypothetical protein GcC1_c13478o13 [Golovinomyces cichoracearum]